VSKRVVFGVGPVRELLAARPDAISALWVSASREQRGERVPPRGGAPRDPRGGRDPVAELADAARAAGVAVQARERHALDELVGPGATHQGVVAIARDFRYAALEDITAAVDAGAGPGLVVVLDGVTDPHNLGAIARSAYLCGAHGLVVPRDRAAQVNAVATKASAGAVEHLPIAQVTNLSRALDELKQFGLWIAAVADAPDARPPWGVDGTMPLVLVLGAEGSGIRPLVAKQADFRIVIPMAGRAVGSFNVSVAAGIALYEVARQRDARRD
jgi:23S rRNA (guanosine2251-2'-O)-methyltransferase